MSGYSDTLSVGSSLDEPVDSELSFEELEPREAPTFLLVCYEDNTY